MLTVNVKTHLNEHIYEAVEVHGHCSKVSGHVDMVSIIFADGDSYEVSEEDNPCMSIFVMNQSGKTVASYQFSGKSEVFGDKTAA